MRKHVAEMARRPGAEIHAMDSGAGLWTPDCLWTPEECDRRGVEHGRYGDQPYPLEPGEADALAQMGVRDLR